MFTRVGALLEAIDKKTEELANAADDEALARAAEQQQLALHPAKDHNGGTFQESHLGEHPGGRGKATGSSRDNFPNAATPPSVMISSAHPASHETYAAGHVPLSLPTKLPSFRPSTQGLEVDGGRGDAAGGGKQNRTASTAADPLAGNSLVSSQGDAASASSPARARGEAAINNTSAAEAAAERLEARCRTLESDKLRWQQEAAAYRAQCSAARDALWKAEQDTRASRAAQRAAEQALAVYKGTSQRLLDEAQQELKQARDAAAGQASATAPRPQTDNLHDALELRQRLELLQTEHASLNAEVERYREEATKATAELQRMQEEHRQAHMRVELLQHEVGAARESLEGAVFAHAETRSALRRLQEQKDELLKSESSPSSSAAVAQGTGEAGSTTDVSLLQREFNELKQRHQLLTLQASNLQAALDAAAREAADMKAQYNELAKHVNDAEVEMEAGFRVSAIYRDGNGCSNGFPAPPTASSMRGYRGLSTDWNGVGRHSADAGAHSAYSAGTAATTPENSGDARRRNAAMVRLARQYGIAGRAVAETICSIDSFAIQVGRILTQAQWMWRVALMCYIGLLQVWVVLIIIGTLALEDNVQVLEPTKVSAPL
ncbi:hypothetical protein, conserved [Leishmania tarentolae]|uniref:Uncharacterized protein n=1 Tax=Leishmania tarentolae TaxID=5689 RepID=A0A640KFY6_LEITA|nr:hypothetical protein, conserved [Leishmania tarentolae]